MRSEAVRKIVSGREPVTVLTGAGISAESGIPTFRGPEGYWTVESTVYHPQDMATFAMFSERPWEVWKWYLYRLAICMQADPNPGHTALVTLEKHFKDRFTLITQNVDGLHLRAGSTPPRTFQIHGNVEYMRCAAACNNRLYPIPAQLHRRIKPARLSPADRALLTCPSCGEMSRPHVLWFDETYDETFFRFRSSMEVAAATRLLIVVGTSGATNLPNQVVHTVYGTGGTIIDINIEENPFSAMAQASPGGDFIKSTAANALTQLVGVLTEAAGS
jgi:NAD-dependent deacetylase